MNGEFALTDEQKAAMEQLKSVAPSLSYELAHRYLVMEDPTLFDNTGDDIAAVRMNWIPSELPVETPPAST